MDKEKNVKKNKTLIITVAVIAAVTLILASVLIFADGITARKKLSEFKSNISECREIVVSSPNYFDGLSSGAELVLRDDEAKALVEEILGISESLGFDEILRGGSWDMILRFYLGDMSYTAYAESDRIIIYDGRGYAFNIKEDAVSDYDAFYQKLNDLIEESK